LKNRNFNTNRSYFWR